MSWRRANKNSLTWWYILKTSWRCLENIFTMLLENLLKTTWRSRGKTSSRCLEGILKVSWKRFCKTYWRRLTRRYENVWARLTYSSWSRHLEEVLKTSSKDVWLRRIWLWTYNNSFFGRELESVRAQFLLGK